MSTSLPTTILLGCAPQVRVVIIEDEGNLVLQVFAEDPEATDIDALFFNLMDDGDAANLTIYPEFNEGIGSNGENLTGFDVAPGTLNMVGNGAQIQQLYDVRLEFGDVPYTSGGDVDVAMLTLYVDGGGTLLTADSIDLSNMTAVVNSDGGNGLALTGGLGAAPDQTPVTVTYSEDFNGLTDAEDSTLIASDDDWALNSIGLYTNGSNDGTLALESLDTEGPAALSFVARVSNPQEFENSGAYEDSLRVEVSIDGGEYVLLDEFQVADSGRFLIGSETGQIIGPLTSNLDYSGGILDMATDSVQFRLVSDISADNEGILIGDLQIDVTELEGDAPADPVETVLQSVDFDNVDDPIAEQDVIRDGGWDVRNGEAKTDGCNDGRLVLAEVAASDPVELSMDMRAKGLENFENSGWAADELTVQVQIDGGTWTTLDTFMVNDDGTAMVGDTTGQTFGTEMTTLTYSGGVLDTASEDVQFRLISDITARDEKIFVDNIEVVTLTDTDDADETCEDLEDFEDAAAGDTAALQFDGFSVTAQRDGDRADSENDAMIFDSAAPTGGDSDLGYSAQGNILIISEDNDASDPDDEAHGGTITFEFDEVSDVTSLTVLDVEEEGGAVDLYDIEGELINSVAIPAAGDNSSQELEINTGGVATMEVTLSGSGAVDDLCFETSGGDNTDPECGQYEVTYDDLMVPPAPFEEPADLPHDEILDDIMI
jgi:hypothetical protein